MELLRISCRIDGWGLGRACAWIARSWLFVDNDNERVVHILEDLCHGSVRAYPYSQFNMVP